MIVSSQTNMIKVNNDKFVTMDPGEKYKVDPNEECKRFLFFTRLQYIQRQQI